MGLITFVDMTTLLIDNYDSFTNNLLDYLHQLNQKVVVIQNDTYHIDQLEQLVFDNILISPGPNSPDQAGICLQVLDRYHDKKPILGVCLGHQVIGQYFGAKVNKAQRPMHGYTSDIQLTNHPLLHAIPSKTKVMRYHSLLVEQVPECMEILAVTDANEVMIIKHKHLKIMGLQFHPESILTAAGIIYLKNWFDYIGLAGK